MKLSIQKAVTGNSNCPVTGKTYVVGNPVGPTPPEPGDRFIDGEKGAQIKCSVKGSGMFSFSGSIKATSSEQDPVTVTFTDGVIDAATKTGTATLAVYTKELAGAFTSPAGGCTVTVIGDNLRGGSLWASFSCQSINNPTTAQACSVGPVGATISNVIFENCEGSP